MKIDEIEIGEVYTVDSSYKPGSGRRLRAEDIVEDWSGNGGFRSRKQRMVEVVWLRGDDGDEPESPQPHQTIFPARDLTPWGPYREERDARRVESQRKDAFSQRLQLALRRHGIEYDSHAVRSGHGGPGRWDVTLAEREMLHLVETLEMAPRIERSA